MNNIIEDYCNNCLVDTLQIKGLCEPKDCKALYLNDFVDINVKDLANLANSEELSGYAFGESLLKRASIKVISAVQQMMPQNYSLNRSIETSCSTCEFNSLTGSGNGIIVRNTTGSTSSITNISQLRISTQNTGLEAIVIDDGLTQTLYPVNLNGGEQSLEIPNYSTSQKLIKIYFQNQNVVLNAVVCATASGCGCGGTKSSNEPKGYAIAGLTNGVESSTQYGFLPCITTSCSFDYLICNLAKTNKILVAEAMALSIHVDVLNRQINSDRLNKKTLVDADLISEYRDMQVRKFDEVLFGRLDGYGKPQRAGIKDVISDTLRHSHDSCVMCVATNYSATPKV
ncbi:MAG: hypothetical protein ACEQSR_08600 [Candidatus Methylacidiphilales bacterium]